MTYNKYIDNRMINLSGTMPILKTDLSISHRMRYTILTIMLPVNVKKNGFDLLVSTYKVVREGVTIFPIGMLGTAEHLTFPRQPYTEPGRPTAWVGKVRFSDYFLSIGYLEVARCAPFYAKDLRNLNKVAATIYEAYRMEYFHDIKYAGHEMLAWI